MKHQRRSTREEIQSQELKNAFDDFLVSRQSIRCSASTLTFYRNIGQAFLVWVEKEVHVSSPGQITSMHVRSFLADLGSKTTSDWTLNDYARAIRTLLRFWNTEEIIPKPITFQMPKVRKKKMPVLTANELRVVIRACDTLRDKALILIMADSGLRRAEVIALDWDHINIKTGICKVVEGKGGKSRIVVIGPYALQALQEYRTTINSSTPTDPVIQTKQGTRFTSGGIQQVFIRLSKKAGIHVAPHMFRRTFVKLSLRNNMNPLYLKDLLGHETLDMVMYYAGQFDDDELMTAHNRHSPIEHIMQTNAISM